MKNTTDKQRSPSTNGDGGRDARVPQTVVEKTFRASVITADVLALVLLLVLAVSPSRLHALVPAGAVAAVVFVAAAASVTAVIVFARHRRR